MSVTLNAESATLIKQYEEEVGPIGVTDGISKGRLPSGLPSLDALLCGGLPIGHITNVVGDAATGKSTMALHFLARNGGILIDVDRSYDAAYAHAVGVKHADLGYIRTNDIEVVSQSIVAALEAGVKLVVVDSLGSLVTVDTLGPTWAPWFLDGMLPLWRRVANETDGALLLVDGVRTNLGFGSSLHSSAGAIVSTNSVLRLYMAHWGYRVIANVVKDVLVPGIRSIPLDYKEGRGFSVAASMLDYELSTGRIQKLGSWYRRDDYYIGQGRAEVIRAIEEAGWDVADI